MIELPAAIVHGLPMQTLNEEVKMFDGHAVLQGNNVQICLDLVVVFKWLPSPRVIFRGNYLGNFNVALYDSPKLSVGAEEYKIIITHLRATQNYIEGVLNEKFITGSKEVEADHVDFIISNMQGLYGHAVKFPEGVMMAARISLDSPSLTVNVDMIKNFKIYYKELVTNSGYFPLHHGRMMSKAGPMSLSQATNNLEIVGDFFSFMNGSKAVPLFREGHRDGSICWRDFSGEYVPMFRDVRNWSSCRYLELSDLWSEFLNHYQDHDSQYCLSLIIYWYTQANTATLGEQGIILAQCALELLFEWMTVVRKPTFPVIGKSDFAASKISRMLELIKVDNVIPPLLKYLTTFDVPKAENAAMKIVGVRNSFTHPTTNNRALATKLSPEVIAETLQLQIHYIELVLLYALGYNGKYYNRCAEFGKNEELVPWKID